MENVRLETSEEQLDSPTVSDTNPRGLSVALGRRSTHCRTQTLGPGRGLGKEAVGVAQLLQPQSPGLATRRPRDRPATLPDSTGLS